MATMTICNTVAFAPATAARLERLAKRCGVSKLEAMWRSLEAAELTEAEVSTREPIQSGPPTRHQNAEMSPPEALAWLREHPLVTAEEGVQWRQEMRRTREDFSERP